MCGICGLFNANGAPVDRRALAAMTSALVHRGPDAGGLWVGGAFGLGHRRLSIIDLAGGRQPMRLPERGLTLAYNGEVYNFRELRTRLEQRHGVVFRTRSDTEVLLHLYALRGPEMLEELNGMFAFALVDEPNRTLFLARDRLGQKPLFYFFRDGCLAFASELEALMHAPGFPREIRPQAVHDYLAFQYVPAPDTIYRGVRKLPPAHCLEVSYGQERAPEPRRYWRLRFGAPGKFAGTFAEAADCLRELLTDAVRLRLVSDVALGAFLSGGMDSSITVGLMSRLLERPVETFTIGFPEGKYDERRFAEAAATAFATHHHCRVVDPRDFGVIRRLVRRYGEPFSDASMLPTSLLAEFTRSKVTVALSGDGADELFGGYYRYTVMNAARVFDFLPLALRTPLIRALLRALPPRIEERTWTGRLRRVLELGRSAHPARRYHDLISRFSETLKHRVYGPALADADLAPSWTVLERALAAATAPHPVERIAEVDVHTYLPGDILTKVDIASMAHSLEVRSPFLDPRVVEFAAGLPWEYKQGRGRRKRILRAAFADLAPGEILRRSKMGFGVPLARWFRGEWAGLLREVLLDPAVRRAGWFRPDAVEGLITEHVERRTDHSYALWALLLFELWRREVHETACGGSRAPAPVAPPAIENRSGQR